MCLSNPMTCKAAYVDDGSRDMLVGLRAFSRSSRNLSDPAGPAISQATCRPPKGGGGGKGLVKVRGS